MIDLSKYKNTDEFLYMMLDRLRSDCEYYLGSGHRAAKHLWANNEKDQINLMLRIWGNFPEDAKPEWLTLEEIQEYRKEMIN